jgi:biopolymer transport protein ExbD
MNAGSGNKTRSEINVTPLIDIVLVLLIVFIVMVPSLSKVMNANIPIVKPTPEDAAKPPQPPVVISLDQSGKLFLQNEEIQLNELANRLAPVVKLQPWRMRKVFLKVDEDLPNQRAIDVMDQIRVASIRIQEESKTTTGTQDDGGEVKVALSLNKRT